jgi:hypothetical protein
MPFKRRAFSIESSPFALNKVNGFHGSNYCAGPNYSTFSQSAQHKGGTATGISYWFSLVDVARQFAFHQKGSRWKTWSFLAGILVMLILLRVGVRSKHLIQRDSFSSDEEWDYNHYASETYENDQRHLLMVQQSTGSTAALGYSRITSRPNRAYARQWGIDFHLTFDCHCPAQLLLDVYQMQWYEGEEEVPVYDAVLFLTSDSIVTDMDYDILTLLPEDKLATVTSNGEKLRMINLRHDIFPTLVKLWLTSCDAPLQDMVESVTSDYITIHPSEAGFLEPRLVRFSDRPTTLQTTADSVCYRYYPRCDVL